MKDPIGEVNALGGDPNRSAKAPLNITNTPPALADLEVRVLLDDDPSNTPRLTIHA